MTTLIVGATGATGRLLVGQLLDRGRNVRAIVRSPDKLPEALRQHERLSIIRAGVLDLRDEQLAGHVAGCDAVASCLGHTLSFRGMFGPPRRLVAHATRRLCEAIRAHHPPRPVRIVLMNTAGNRNRDLDEPISLGQRWVIGLIRLLLPPHADNEQAADFLRTAVGPDDPAVEWVAVRPDSLVNHEAVSEYQVHRSPTRSVIFNPGRTSRINVAHFMAELITDDQRWRQWRGQMPVIYNRSTD
jgi:NAD(P)-dependent dehydrogenase (short-subunit alcohol dehydrogenase family)